VSTPVPVEPPVRASGFPGPAAYTPKHLAEKILVSRAAIEGERKQVTVVFCDVANYTSFSESLDPEEVHAVMDRVFEVVLGAVHHYEGTVNQFLGDGVMALFGAPIAHEDHAERACRAALAIRRELEPVREDVQRRFGRDFRMRIGINTGLVVVGAIGRDLRMDYTAVGDTTNLAARLMALAQPGQIIASRYTEHLRRDFFLFEDLGEFMVKGKPHPVQAFALLDEVRGRTRLEVSRARGLTPFAGRDEELRRLLSAWDGARAGAGAVVVVTGEPGVGKSRLLYEFINAARPATTYDVSCVSHGRGVPFYPVLELLRAVLGVTESTPESEIRASIGERLNAIAPDDDTAAMMVAHFLGLPTPAEWLNRMSPAHLKVRTLQLVRGLLLGDAESAPVAIVVENLHWIDASSDDVLRSLAGDVGSRAVLLILTSRPGADAAALAAATERIALGGIGADCVPRMVRELAGAQTVSAALVDVMIAKAAGNPLYMEEMVAQLRDTGGLVVEGGEATLSAAAVRVPATIHDLIAARVDRLEDQLKQTLQAAAVVGREFSLALLEAVSGIGETLPDHLARLHAADFVFPLDSEVEPAYAFKHALTQDVVYGSLLDRRRRGYHGAAGQALEAMYADRLTDAVELLAHHFDAAGDGDKAVDYSLLAAEKAQQRWANQDALARFDAVRGRLDSMPDTPANRMRRIDAVVKQAELQFALGRHAEHIERLEAIRTLVDADADPSRRAAWYYWAGLLHSLTGSAPGVAMAYCRTAADIADEGGFDELGAFAHCCLTQVFAVAGQIPEALAAGSRALPVFEKRDNRWWVCRTLWSLSMAANVAGLWTQSLEYCSRGLEYGRAMKDLRLIVVGTWRTGSTHIQRGDVAAGLQWCDDALALSSPIPFDDAMIRAVRGLGLVKGGDGPAGIDALEQSVRWFERSSLWYTRSVVTMWLAEARLRAGDADTARRLGTEILETARRLGYRQLEGVACRVIGHAALELGSGEAREMLATSAGLLERAGARNDHALTMVSQAELCRRAGDSAGAARLLDAAITVFADLGTIDALAAATSARGALRTR
jgi:class 3 adenylate cyclase/tetratricopeptide (TPR) repeat protein